MHSDTRTTFILILEAVTSTRIGIPHTVSSTGHPPLPSVLSPHPCTAAWAGRQNGGRSATGRAHSFNFMNGHENLHGRLYPACFSHC
ncbi:MAG: hypothetical protein Q4F72_09125 [Desulfovibrionaceae bacterium]|nr:hypothetical protein [Desulfovibrionaceae bacterium]